MIEAGSAAPLVAQRAMAATDRILSALSTLHRYELIEDAEYRNAAARWLRLKADLLRRLGQDDFAVGVEQLILAHFADPVFRPPAPPDTPDTAPYAGEVQS